jgi:hypothetical protein
MTVANLEKAKLVWRVVWPNDECLDIPNVGISTGDSKRYTGNPFKLAKCREQ